MQVTITTKFYHFSQNNSGGYFIENNEHGVCEDIIIEAQNSKEAWGRLENIGESVDSFWSACSCCGDRWSNWLDDEDGTDVPMRYDTPVIDEVKSVFRGRCFVHYYDNTFKQFKYKA